jgi:hypothetical protein
MSWIASTPQSRQPLDHDTPWKRFKHAVGACMAEAGWPGGPAWYLDDGLYEPVVPGHIDATDMDKWRDDLALATWYAADIDDADVVYVGVPLPAVVASSVAPDGGAA